MKIVHLCLGNYFADGFAYQENLLTKMHKQLGYDVEVIASTQSFDANGKICYLTETGSYINEHGIQVTRLPYKWNNSMGHKLKRYVGTFAALEKAAPDILFIHNVQFLDSSVVVKYLKAHPNVTVYADNHADYANSATNWVSRNILHKILWKRCAHRLKPYVKKFYGVLPVRVRFLTDVYGLPKEKCELLVMGVDDELVAQATAPASVENVRKQYGVAQDDFLIVTGGKINGYRPETLNLMRAVTRLSNTKCKVLVFGVVSQELQAEFDALCSNERVIFAGWKTPAETNSLMAAADLVAFPGLHSVMWEQAVGLGVPCAFRRIEGVDHVDLGGNTVFIDDTADDALQNLLETLLTDTAQYENMRVVAQQKGMQTFSYRKIAERCIGECAE